MGANLSTPPPQNPNNLNPSQSTPTMSSSIPPNLQNPDPNPLENQNPDPKTLDNHTPEISDQPTSPIEKGRNQTPQENRENNEENQQQEEEEEEEEEEEGECGFCLFMKGGGCKDEFIAWENCVEEAEKNKEDIVEKCFEVTGNLKKCMEAHSDYYEPILRAEKAADDQVNQELKNHDEKANSGVKEVEQIFEIEVEKQG